MGNTVPYFYYATISRDYSWWPLVTRRHIARSTRLYLDDLLRYTGFSVAEDASTQLEVELKQSFLLIAYQGYLDQYEMQLVHIFLCGAVSSVLAVLLVWLFK